jgi:hypothetical protein
MKTLKRFAHDAAHDGLHDAAREGLTPAIRLLLMLGF